MKTNIIFLTNEKYISEESAEGGVKFCTQEYISLLQLRFTVIFFAVQLDNSFWYRIKKKFGLTVYHDYNVRKYITTLKEAINKNHVSCVFLNLTNTVQFSKLIKELFPDIKVILCSHGNESGDYLHEVVMHKKRSFLKRYAADYFLGSMLSQESSYRKYIDLVLTVSDVEMYIEKWLGAEKIYLVYRTITGAEIDNNPIKGRIGFFADLSHAPNFYGIKKVCEALQSRKDNSVEIRLVGSCEKNGNALALEFPFLKYLGYLDEDHLKLEAGTWMFCLNPVFYYSRGVSTKLGKMLQWGLPVITTRKGMRGYTWKEGEILECDSANEMATLIMNYCNNITAAVKYKNEIVKMRATAPSQESMANDIINILAVSA